MKVGLWSTTAGSNNSTPPDGWPEGQAPSTINDCAREMMAQVKTAFADAQWFDHGMSPTYINANSFSVPGNQLTLLEAGRRVKLYDGTTIYRPIAASSYTTVTTVSLGAGTVITSSLSSFAVAAMSQTNNTLPVDASFSGVSCLALSATIANVGTLSCTTVITNAISAHACTIDVGLELGTVGASNTPYIDFHSSGNNIDYDVRMIASNGNPAIGQGLLTVNALQGLVCTGPVVQNSDERLKKDWAQLPNVFLERLQRVLYGTYTDPAGNRRAGVGAQSLQLVMPEVVHEPTDQNPYLSVAYGEAAMVIALELAHAVGVLRKRVAELEKK